MENDTNVIERASAVPETRGLMRCHADAWELFGIYLMNLVLMVLTLGIYRFWAKTRIRRFLWGNVEILGDRLEYTGTGKEMFLGFLVVFFLILMPLFGGLAFLDQALAGEHEELRAGLGLVQIIAIVFLVGVALFRARRYRLTRTHWRGIYGGQTGSSVKYGLMGLASYVLVAPTLGLAWPACSVWLTRYEMNNTWIGDEQPEFNPSVKKLYRLFMVPWLIGATSMGLFMFAIFSVLGDLGTSLEGGANPDPEATAAAAGFVAVAYLLMIPAMLAILWYRGKAYSHFIASTRFHGHGLSSAITGMGFMWLTISNMLLIVFTLGLGVPFTYKRVLTFVERKVGLVGDGDFSALLQSTQEKPTRGEGLADAFDIGGI